MHDHQLILIGDRQSGKTGWALASVVSHHLRQHPSVGFQKPLLWVEARPASARSASQLLAFASPQLSRCNYVAIVWSSRERIRGAGPWGTIVVHEPDSFATSPKEMFEWLNTQRTDLLAWVGTPGKNHILRYVLRGCEQKADPNDFCSDTKILRTDFEGNSFTSPRDDM